MVLKAIVLISAIQILGSYHVHAAPAVLSSAKNFQEDTSNLPNLMKLVGNARTLAIAGCPEAVELIIRSYNAYLYSEKPGAPSYMYLVNQVAQCKKK